MSIAAAYQGHVSPNISCMKHPGILEHTQQGSDVGVLQAGKEAYRNFMKSPGADKLKKLRMLMGMLYFMAGRVVRGWSTFAPK